MVTYGLPNAEHHGAFVKIDKNGQGNYLVLTAIQSRVNSCSQLGSSLDIVEVESPPFPLTPSLYHPTLSPSLSLSLSLSLKLQPSLHVSLPPSLPLSLPL